MTQQLLGDIQSIKILLLIKQVAEAVNQCQQLVTASSENLTEDCEEIVGDVIEIASCLKEEESHYVTALSMMKWAMPMFGKIRGSKEKLLKMNECHSAVLDVMLVMNNAGKKEDIKEECLPLLQQLLEQVKLVQLKDVKYKSNEEAWCMSGIGLCYTSNDDYEQAGSVYSEAIVLMESVCGVDYKKYSVVATCYCSYGVVKYFMGKYEDAEKLFKQSIDIYKSVQDISMEIRKMCFKEAESWLNKIRSKQSNQ